MNDPPKKIIDEIVEIVKSHLDPTRILLFGSRAKGKDKAYSDFDIAVEGAKVDLRKERLVKDALNEKTGIFSVDLIDLDHVDAEFRSLVLRTGKVLYEK